MQTKLEMKPKPWIKATSDGRLYIDTSNPKWKEWFSLEIERYRKSKLFKTVNQ